MKFRDVALGNRAIKTIPLPLVHEPGSSVEQKPLTVALRVLNGDETAEILENAAEFARGRGSKEPKAGDPLYELGIRVHTLLMACVDPDAPNPESPDARFFASVEEILGSHLIGRDVIFYLYEAQEAWQDHCSPQPKEISGDEFWGAIAELAKSNDPLVFERYRPALRWSLARSMAALLLSSLQPKSGSGSSSASTGLTGKKGRRRRRSTDSAAPGEGS